MTEDELEQATKLLNERAKKFTDAISAAGLGHLPHILFVFDDTGRDVLAEATAHFQNPLLRMQVLLDILKHHVHAIQQQQNASMDEVLLMNLFSGRTPIA